MTIQVPLTSVNQSPYLRTSREFPEESVHQLAVEINKTYLEIAGSVNNRIIGIFPVNRPALTGESWYTVGSQRQQTLRQVYTFTSTSNIAHGINLSAISGFSRPFGIFTDGTNWYGLIAGSNVAIAGQISFYITPTNIVFLSGAGAPSVTKGQLVLEWLSFV